MNTKAFYTFIILSFLTAYSHQMVAQNLSLDIKKTDGMDKNINLNTLKKITFSITDMIVNYQTGINENLSLSSIQKLSFSPITSVQNTFENNEIVAYPIPSHNSLTIKNIPLGVSELCIYSMSGTKLIILNVLNNKIDISGLAKGIYLMKINNQILKFTKQ